MEVFGCVESILWEGEVEKEFFGLGACVGNRELSWCPFLDEVEGVVAVFVFLP